MTGFRRLAFSTLGAPGRTVNEVLDLARRHAMGAVEFRSAIGTAASTSMSPDERRQARESFEAADILVLALGTYVGLASDSDSLEREIDLAADLGAAAIRVFMRDSDIVGDPRGLTAGEETALDRLSDTRSVAESAGVRILIETHDAHAATDRLARFLTAVDAALPEHMIGAIWDTAHPWARGEALHHSFTNLEPWLGHLQVKDERSPQDPRPCRLGDGTFPIGELTALLDSVGWSGWASLEWESQWHPELPDLDEALGVLRSWAPGLQHSEERQESDTRR